jgi:hypothetical protein
MRTSTRESLYALAAAWQASTGSNVCPFTRPASSRSSRADAATTTDAEPPYWPDGPSAA